MSLIRKTVTPKALAANRANSQKSTGPSLATLAKMSSRPDLAKHWAFAKVSPRSMSLLGEDPADFKKFRDGFGNALAPQDEFEECWVVEMIDIRWRLRRLLRAEAGILATRRRKMEIELQEQVAYQGREPGTASEGALVGNSGLLGLPGAPSKFTRVLQFLKSVRATVETSGFQDAGLKFLQSAQVPNSGMTEALVAANYERCQSQQAQDASTEETKRKFFLQWLEAEIASFEKLEEVHHAAEPELAQAMMDAQLLLPDKDLEKIIRYQTALERLFERKLHQYTAWRKAGQEEWERIAAEVGRGFGR